MEHRSRGPDRKPSAAFARKLIADADRDVTIGDVTIGKRHLPVTGSAGRLTVEGWPEDLGVVGEWLALHGFSVGITAKWREDSADADCWLVVSW